MPDAIAGIAYILLDLAFFPTCCRITEFRFKQEVADHGLEPLIDVSPLAAIHLIDSRFHVVVNTSLRDTTQGDKGVVMGIKQHLMGLQWVGPQHKGPAVTEFEVGNLQFGSLTTNDHPVLGSVERKGFAWSEDQGGKCSFARR
jgi:hypothetical protein